MFRAAYLQGRQDKNKAFFLLSLAIKASSSLAVFAFFCIYNGVMLFYDGMRMSAKKKLGIIIHTAALYIP